MDFEPEEQHWANIRDPQSWWNIGAAAACVVCAALAAGLTVGLMSLDPLELEVKRRVGTPEERRHAEKICPIIGRHHRLLVTLLLFNSLANEALPIFLAELVPSYVAVLLSVTAILIFGEIIPSAMFTGPQQIVMASRLSGFVFLLMGLFYPIARPIAWVLDRWLGHTSFKRYTREELSALVELQREEHHHPLRSRRTTPTNAGGGGGPDASQHQQHRGGSTAREKELGDASRPSITMDESTIIDGVLKCHSKKIKDAMKPMDEVYALCEDDVLDENRLCEIMACGFSRIPVHSSRGRGDIRGFLLVKRLIVLDPDDKRPIKTLPLRQPIVVSPNGSLLELINVFQEGRSHMAIVSPCPELTRQALRSGKPLEGKTAPLGLITLEDLFEEILQEEIYDEHDARERKAIETLRKVRRKVRRQRQLAAEQAARKANGEGTNGESTPTMGSSAASSPVSVASPHYHHGHGQQHGHGHHYHHHHAHHRAVPIPTQAAEVGDEGEGGGGDVTSRLLGAFKAATGAASSLPASLAGFRRRNSGSSGGSSSGGGGGGLPPAVLNGTGSNGHHEKLATSRGAPPSYGSTSSDAHQSSSSLRPQQQQQQQQQLQPQDAGGLPV